ncbi:CoA transferase [Rhodococcus sp. H29-C3]|uniref:CaiB/BaiF CoA transferase family protein n=1 Tax=Rhodococcus sp. H29-C3 TaxID=3046307 RepID=UPI0024B9B8ED|nr:CoA transferase [Rhodococcus sp. H29-C3]MDJ0361868.1 CoA transferase [Rhodococcus sp. H29-C3]
MVEKTSGPLTGLTVIELGRFVAAPLAGRLLADWGADVIKVEAPAGDPMRWGPMGERPGFSPQFASFNRGKRSVTLDLKSEAGREALRALLAGADVLIHNMRAAALVRLGIDPELVSSQFPDLVLCGISGFGDVGPYASSQAFDSIVSGVSGLYSQYCEPDQLVPVGPSLSDILTGMYAAQSVLAALHARSARGTGQRVEVSMLESVVNAIDDAFTTHFEADAPVGPQTRQERQHVFACPAGDGLSFVVQVSSAPSQWQKFAELFSERSNTAALLDDPSFIDYDTRITHFVELAALVSAAASSRPRADWLADLQGLDIAAGPVNSITDAISDPQVQAGEMITEIAMPDGPPLRMTRAVGSFSQTPLSSVVRPPEAGEHTLEVLDQFDLTPAQRESVEQVWRTRRRYR